MSQIAPRFAITSDDIDTVMRRFYRLIRADAALGPIFAAHVTDWPEHEAKIARFWKKAILHEDSYSGNPMMTHMGVAEGQEWEPMATVSDAAGFQAYLDQVPFFAKGARRYSDARLSVPAVAVDTSREISTQMAFGKVLDDLSKGDSALAARIVTMSPDVTGTTNLGPWVNRRKLFARTPQADTFMDEKIPSTAKWEFTPEGQHIELGIAEMNLFLLLGAAGLSHSIFGKRVIPIGTVYDPFVARGLDALNYACYQDARFMIVGTPSGVTLAPEGGAHQSIGSPLIGMSQDGLASFEPAFADELAVIMQWAFAYLQKDGAGDPDERTWLRDETGGSVYLRLTTNPIEQTGKRVDEDFKQGAIDGAYWLRKPGPNCDVVIAYQGAVAPEAIKAAGIIAESRRDVGVLAVTSADRLNAGWTAAQRARSRGQKGAQSHIETLLGQVATHSKIVTVIDGHPATLAWLGSVDGHQTIPLGVEHFGQTGTIADLYAHFGIDAASIVAKVAGLTDGRNRFSGVP